MLITLWQSLVNKFCFCLLSKIYLWSGPK